MGPFIDIVVLTILSTMFLVGVGLILADLAQHPESNFPHDPIATSTPVLWLMQ